MKVGVIGAGTMGSGIAQTFAQAEGYKVLLTDINIDFANKGKAKIEGNLFKRVEKGKMQQAEADDILNNITTGLNKDFGDCDLVVEAVLEDMELKKNTFTTLEKVCKKDCIFATNTSSKSITEIGSYANRPVIGMHFFNPAPVMKLIEIIPGFNTPEETTSKVLKIAESLGKTPVLVKDSAGFVVNRILIPMINEAVGICAEGIASPEGIDTAMKLGANHPMGPLELGDLVGLDVCLAIMDTLYEETKDSKYRANPLLRKMVRGRKLGRKTGEGFYNYK